MTKTPRWMRSVIAASTEATPAMPWARNLRRKPESLKSQKVAPRAIAAR